MRILHVIPSISERHGGPTQALLIIEKALSSAGVEITTLTTDDDGGGRRLNDNFCPTVVHGASRVYCRKWMDTYKVTPGMLPWLWRRVSGFDVVHIHALFSFSSAAAALLARWRGVPYIVRPLGTLNAYGMRRRPWLKRLSLAVLEAPVLRAAAAVHFTTEAEHEEAKALRVPLLGVVVPLAVEEEAPGDAGRLLRRHPELGGRRIVLYLSRLDPKKNLEHLLEAFGAPELRRHDVALLVAGDGSPDYVARLKTLAGALGLGSRVLWLGHVNGPDKADALAAADVFVLPSLSENFGIAVVEAMLAGLPCVLGEGVAIAREVQDGGAGIVVAPESDAIAHVLADVLDDDARRRAMGERARSLARRAFSTQAMVERLLALYGRLAAGKGRPDG